MVETLARLEKGVLEKRTEGTVPRRHEGNTLMDILNRLRAREHFDTWNGEFVSKEAADEIERLREILFSMNCKMVEMEIAYNKLLKKQKAKTEDAERISTIRKQMNLNQVEFAKKIGLSQSHISDLENGRKIMTDAVHEKLERLINGNP